MPLLALALELFSWFRFRQASNIAYAVVEDEGFEGKLGSRATVFYYDDDAFWAPKYRLSMTAAGVLHVGDGEANFIGRTGEGEHIERSFRAGSATVKRLGSYEDFGKKGAFWLEIREGSEGHVFSLVPHAKNNAELELRDRFCRALEECLGITPLRSFYGVALRLLGPNGFYKLLVEDGVISGARIGGQVFDRVSASQFRGLTLLVMPYIKRSLWKRREAEVRCDATTPGSVEFMSLDRRNFRYEARKIEKIVLNKGRSANVDFKNSGKIGFHLADGSKRNFYLMGKVEIEEVADLLGGAGIKVEVTGWKDLVYDNERFTER